jgi:hypothetical protein
MPPFVIVVVVQLINVIAKLEKWMFFLSWANIYICMNLVHLCHPVK